MVLARWTSKTGWGDPELVECGPIPLMPSASALQYATSCFEGMKAFRGFDGRLRLLRPMYNMKRMESSAARISLPAFDTQELLNLIKRLCAYEAPKWLPPSQAGSALYIRPTLMGTDISLGFKIPEEAILCIFLMYWPAPNGLGGIKLLTSNENSVRAFPGGTGAAKIGANYGPSLAEHTRARENGCDQVLWLFGPDREVTEAGGANMFVMLRSPDGQLQIITAPLDEDRLILAGGTRRNLLELARTMFASDREDGIEKCLVTERKIGMPEVVSAHNDGRLVGMFVAGTAFWVQPVLEVRHEGSTLTLDKDISGHVSVLRQRYTDIVFGREQSDWMEMVDEP